MLPDQLAEHWRGVGLRGDHIPLASRLPFTFPTIEFYGVKAWNGRFPPPSQGMPHTSRGRTVGPGLKRRTAKLFKDPNSRVITDGRFRCFSNYFEHAAITFTIPECCKAAELEAAGRKRACTVTTSEQSITLCKAAVFQDYQKFDQILGSTNPSQAKNLGCKVKPWDKTTWEGVVCEVARAAVLRKFLAVPGLAEILLSTDRSVIGEMKESDCIWGTGLDRQHPDASTPGKWRGTNILGWALMEAREELREEEEEDEEEEEEEDEDGAPGEGYSNGICRTNKLTVQWFLAHKKTHPPRTIVGP